ncbi:helicase-like protein, partial [Trypanosoma cruzi]
RRLPTVPLEEDSFSEGRVMHFLALDVTTWAPRVWNEGISEVVVGSRSAYSYKCLHQADAQVQPAFDGSVSCRRALETERDSADRFMDLFRALLQTFQLQMMTTESSVPISELRARPRNSNDRCDADCDVFMDATHPRATYAARPEGITHNAGVHQKTAEGLPHAAHECWRRGLHPFRQLPPTLTGSAPRRRRSTRSFELPDAIVEKGKGAYLPTTPDCGMTNYRHPRFGPVI